MQNNFTTPHKKATALASILILGIVALVIVLRMSQQRIVTLPAEWAKTTQQLYLPAPTKNTANLNTIPLHVKAVTKYAGDFIPAGLQWFTLDTKPLQAVLEEADQILHATSPTPYANSDDPSALSPIQAQKIVRPTTNLEIEAKQIIMTQSKAALQKIEAEITEKEKSIAILSLEKAKLELAHRSSLDKYHQKKETLENVENKLEELENTRTYMEQVRKEHEFLVGQRLGLSKILQQAETPQQAITTAYQNHITKLVEAKRAYVSQVLSYISEGAPSSGYLHHIFIKPNMELNPSHPLATLIAPDIPLRLILQAPEEVAQTFTNGPCTITFRALKDTLEGNIVAILPPEHPSGNVRIVVNLTAKDDWKSYISYENLTQVFQIQLMQK